MDTLGYLEACKKRLGVQSDYALAAKLGITRSAVSKLQQKKGIFGDDVALKIAEILDRNPLEVIAAANAERAKTEEIRAAWLNLMEKISAGFELLLLGAGPRRIRF